YERHAEEIHRHLFSTFSRGKVSFLAKVLGEIEYFGEGKIAILKLSSKDLDDNGLDMDDSRDVIDMIMNINAVHAAALFREDAPNKYKVSLRSKGHLDVLGSAENLQGGGHMCAAGAYIECDYKKIKDKVV